MAIIDQIPKIESPKLFDRVMQDIQTGLIANLPWLDYAFGKAWRLKKVVDDKTIFFPSVYAGGEEYLEVSPDSNIGNYSFFTFDDPVTYDWQSKIQGSMKSNFSLIFWFDLRNIPNSEGRNTEMVKLEILKSLNGGFQMKNGRINIQRIYERAENIFQSFSLDEVDNQFLMQPFAGFRFYGEMFINEDCIW